MKINTEKLIQGKELTGSFIKNRAFDFIAIGIVIAMTVLSLGVVELRSITLKEFLNIILECVPFYMAATMLSINYYNKGSHVGKSSDKFTDSIKYYSDKVVKLTGEHLKYLPDFCDEYNDKALRAKRERILQTVALTWERFEVGDSDNPPLKVLTKTKLLTMYDKHIVNAIEKCKKAKVKGIHPNMLLSNFTSVDITDLGSTEKQLSRKRFSGYALTYLVSIFTMSLIAVKDILQWGWMGAALTVFKVFYVATGAYMKYFNGYEDVTVGVVNHINRKTDVLKEFDYWYEGLVKQKAAENECISATDNNAIME